jgi:hypothetical protein
MTAIRPPVTRVATARSISMARSRRWAEPPPILGAEAARVGAAALAATPDAAADRPPVVFRTLRDLRTGVPSGRKARNQYIRANANRW